MGREYILIKQLLFFQGSILILLSLDVHWEITYRLSLRLAFFNQTPRKPPCTIYELSKELYKWRSKTVHGLQISKLTPRKSDEILFETEMIVRDSLTKILSDDKIMQAFITKNRESYLDNLILK